MSANLTIEWCRDPASAQELASFFTRNVDPDYISHSELQGPRALSPTEWRGSLTEIVRQELESRLSASQPGTQPVLTARRGEALAGLALVTFASDAPVPFAIIEDLVVEQDSRGMGTGKAIVDWIAAETRQRGIARLFLESGVRNADAHHFFEKNGFHTCSVVMMRTLS